MSAYLVSPANRRLVLLAVMSLIASLLTASFNAPAASAAGESTQFDAASSGPAESAGAHAVTATLTFSDPLLLATVTVPVTVNGSSTATQGAGQDFTLSATNFVFNSGVASPASATINVVINDDAIYETGETVVLDLGIPDIGGLGGTTTHTVTIGDNDTAPVLTIDSPSVSESTGTMAFTVTRTGASEVDASATVNTGTVTATSGADYTAISGGNVTVLGGGGSNTATINVTLANETIYESGETFNVALTSPVDATGTPTGTGTILNDDTAPVLTIDNPPVTEGTANVTFTITRTGLTELSATADVDTANGSAVSPSDYSAIVGGSLTIPSGGPTNTTTIVVAIADDTTSEGVETFDLVLSNPGNAIGTPTGTSTITDDDGSPTLSINDPTVAEDGTSITFTVTRTGLTAQTVGATWTSSNGSAVSGSDYTGGSGSVSIPSGGPTGTDTIVIPVTNGAGTYELTEDFNVTLSAPSNATISDASGLGTITDNDTAPTLAINSPLAVAEDGTSITFTVTRTGLTEVAAGASWTTNDGTAVASTDFTGASGSVSIAPGGGTGTDTVVISLTNDAVYELTETFTVVLSAPTNSTISGATGTGTITDNDTAPTIAIDSPVAVAENGTSITFTVTRTGLTDVAAGANWVTSDGTAAAATDYTAGSGSVSMASGGGTATDTIVVPITNDAINEATEAFTVTISGATDATISGALGTGTINDDDPLPTISISDVTVSEAGTMTFTITRTGFTDQVVGATADSTDGTATAGTDYTAVTSQPVSITGGGSSNTTTLTVPMNNETTYEGSENLTVDLTVPSNATILDGSGLGTITNDDAAPVLTIDSQSVAENVVGGTVTFTVTRTGPTEVTATAFVNSANVTAIAGSDYTAVVNAPISIAPGLTPGTDTVVVTILNDAVDELATETYQMILSAPTNSTLGAPSTGTGTIVDDDGAPVLTIADVGVTEGGVASFTVTKVGTTALDITVRATTSDLTAVQPGDYTSKVQTLTILAAASTATFTVTTVNDVIDEDAEDFRVTLDLPTNAAIGDAIGDGTIADNDAPPVLTITDVTVAESAGTATFTVTRTGLTERIVTVTAQTTDVTAMAGADYVANIDTLSIAPGGATGTDTLVVAISEDFRVESTEIFDVDLSAPGNSTITDGTGVGTITDNDTAGVLITESGGSTDVIEGGATDTYTIVLTARPNADVTVAVTPNAQVTVNAPTVTFTDTDWNVAQTVTVAAVEDATDEIDPHLGLIEHVTTSTDTSFAGLVVADVIPSIGDADSLLVTIDGPSVGAPGVTSTFDAMVNAGGTGTITYEWTVFFGGNPVATGDQASFDFTPTSGGTHIVQAIVGDSQGQNPAVFIPFTVMGDIEGSIFVNNIIWLAEEGITKGCNPPINDAFCPNDFVTRGQMAAFLVRFLGLTDDGGGDLFTDDDNSIFESNIDKLATAGITKGCNAAGDQFCPDDFVTRGQMAAFLVRALGLTDDGGGDLFVDDDTSIFESNIDKLATAGITRGCNPPANTNFCPTDRVTRGQMAAFLQRADKILNP